MEARLEKRRGIGERFEYGGVDWRQVRLLNLLHKHQLPAELWLIVDEENYEQRLDQNNTFIQTSLVMPPLDRITIDDERDDTFWIWFRDETPTFDEMSKSIGVFCTRIYTLYPDEQVVDMFEQRAVEDIREDLNGTS